jgi:glycosyltransferase involved in cell wall biosynthesis
MIKNKFVFIIPFYNCQENIQKTVLSIAAQSYDNWRAILINDISTDNSFEVAKDICFRLPQKEKFLFIDNKEKHGEVRNTLQCLELIDDNEIVCRLDGGDWLVDNDILYYLNEIYQDKEVAVAWTAQRWGHTFYNISGPIDLSKFSNVYEHPWVSSHMKTFVCSYLKQVPKKNFLDDEGNYIMIACDQAIFLPMMHMASQQNKKLVFVPLQAYHYDIDLYDTALPRSERAAKQKISAERIRQRGFLS